MEEGGRFYLKDFALGEYDQKIIVNIGNWILKRKGSSVDLGDSTPFCCPHKIFLDMYEPVPADGSLFQTQGSTLLDRMNTPEIRELLEECREAIECHKDSPPIVLLIGKLNKVLGHEAA